MTTDTPLDQPAPRAGEPRLGSPPNPLDPRHARLVALLYDELPLDEAEALREELTRDAELRAAWSELTAARRMLSTWEIEEREPSFVFVEPPAPPLSQAAHVMSAPPASRRARLGAIATWSGWVAAAAAGLFIVLSGGRARIERLEHGLALQFGATTTPAVAGGATVVAGSFEPAARSASLDAPAGDFATRSDLDAQNEQMLQLMARILSEDRARRDREWGSMLRTIYGDLNDRQFAGYRDLRGRIEAAGIGSGIGRNDRVVSPGGPPALAAPDSLKPRGRGKQPGSRNWKYGDFSDEPERF